MSWGQTWIINGNPVKLTRLDTASLTGQLKEVPAIEKCFSLRRGRGLG